MCGRKWSLKAGEKGRAEAGQIDDVEEGEIQSTRGTQPTIGLEDGGRNIESI